MKSDQFSKSKGMNKSKFTLKKNINYLPQMYLQFATFNKSKDEVLSSYRIKKKKNKSNGTMEMSDLNMFYNHIQRLNTDIRSSGLNYNVLRIKNKSRENKSRMMMKDKGGMIEKNKNLISLNNKPIKSYRTQNNSLVKTNDTIAKNKQNLKPKDKQLLLKIFNNNYKYNKLKSSKGLSSKKTFNTNNNQQKLIQNKYVPASFINFNTQPSSTTNRNTNNTNNESIKIKNSLLSIQVNFDNKNSIDLINDMKKGVNEVIDNDKSSNIFNEVNSKAMEIDSYKKIQSISSNESKEVSDALEYDEVKDIIIYHSFGDLDYLNDYLFKEDDYNYYYANKKETYLKYFQIEKQEASESVMIQKENKKSQSSFLNSKSIPIVEFIV